MELPNNDENNFFINDSLEDSESLEDFGSLGEELGLERRGGRYRASTYDFLRETNNTNDNLDGELFDESDIFINSEFTPKPNDWRDKHFDEIRRKELKKFEFR